MIVEMKKFHLVVLEEDKDNLLRALQKNGNIMLINQDDTDINNKKFDDAIARVKESLKILQPYQEKKKFITEVSEVKYDDFINVEKKSEELVDKIRKINFDIENMENKISALKENNNEYLFWKDFSFKLSDLENTKYTFVHTGIMRNDKINLFIESIKDLSVVYEFKKISSTLVSLVLYTYLDDEVLVDEQLKIYDFQDVSLPKDDKTAKEIIDINNSKIEELTSKIDELKNSFFELAKQKKEIELYSDQMNSIKELNNASYRETLDAIYFEGWVPKKKCNILEKTISNVTPFYDINFEDPGEDEISPTKLENNILVKPFETVTEMFATPSQGEIDPNPVMSFWYWIIFGMMMGDVGYGIIMTLFSTLFIRFKKPRGGTKKMLKVFAYTGISTIIWGVMFGSLFGFELWKPVLVAPIEEPLILLIVSIIVGALHIITGLLAKAYSLIKKRKIWDAIFDQFSWVAILLGIGFIFIPIPGSIYITYGLIGFGVLTIIFTAGRAKKNIFGKAASGLLGLYGITSYMSDILSYSRILALSLSTAVIAYVMNLLAGMVMGSIIGVFFGILIYLVGHTFNIAMGLLSAYVHDGRLQYVEFFGKFYEGGGYPFTPLSLKLEYTYKIIE
ncbi:MAG: V-type ATP synthase subunit I [Bacilli bacterium]|nr:V-type ATP synthase subunit I [Bacilli bacterium]